MEQIILFLTADLMIYFKLTVDVINLFIVFTKVQRHGISFFCSQKKLLLPIRDASTTKIAF